MPNKHPNIQWRPKAYIRPIAIGLIERAGRLLLGAVHDDDGTIKGWRPLGGGIEHGETAQNALRREFLEEVDCRLLNVTAGPVLENIFTHQSHTGHEIVFTFTAQLADQALPVDQTHYANEGKYSVLVEWIDIEDLKSGKTQLFPTGLRDLL